MELLMVAGAVIAVGAVGAALTLRLAKRSVALASIASPITIVCSMAAGLVTGLELMVIEDVGLTLLIIAASTIVALLVGVFVSVVSTRAASVAREQLEQERRAVAAELARRQLVTGLSHDLRTPLAGIQAMAEAIVDGVAPDPKRYVQMIANEAERTAIMLDDVMSLARMQSGNVPVEHENVSLDDLVSDLVAQLKPLAATAQVDVALDRGVCDALPPEACSKSSERSDAAAVEHAYSPGQVTTVSGDPQLLNRVIQNVIANAIQYSRQGSTVRVGVCQSGEFGVLQVADACGGLTDAEKRHMFDVGWRGDQARTPSCTGGSGFGLAIVRMIVDAHQGRIEVADAPGGCSIRIYLPRVDGASRGLEAS